MVCFHRDQCQEFICGWPVDSERWILVSPDGLLVELPVGDPNFYTADCTGKPTYPAGLHELYQFTNALEDDEVLRWVKEARRVALEVRARETAIHSRAFFGL